MAYSACHTNSNCQEWQPQSGHFVLKVTHEINCVSENSVVWPTLQQLKLP